MNWFELFELEFYGPINIVIKVMLSRPANLLTKFLDNLVL